MRRVRVVSGARECDMCGGGSDLFYRVTAVLCDKNDPPTTALCCDQVVFHSSLHVSLWVEVPLRPRRAIACVDARKRLANESDTLLCLHSTARLAEHAQAS